MPGLALAQANLIKDPSFEKPATQGQTTYDTGQKIGAWTVVGDTGNVDTLGKPSRFEGITLQAQHGKLYVDLTGSDDVGTATGVAQTVPTTIGTTYQLTFWVGNADYVNLPQYGTTSTVNVYVGQTLLLSAVNSLGAGKHKQVWEQFTASFVATGTSTTISFINGDPPGDIDCGLDTVSLVATGAPR
jgi:hypothetical protein